jgi:homocysteine S-methyltransferase
MYPNPIENILARYPLMILDGALATELEARGCDLRDPLWSARLLIEDSNLIAAVHRDYYEAGADCVISASYQATLEGFAMRGIELTEAEMLLQLSVELARKVRDDFWNKCSRQVRDTRPHPLVAASIGPYGAFLADGSEYRGDYQLTEEELYHFHRRRMALLVNAEPDLLACETIPCFVEARALVRCLQEHPRMTGWVSFSCRNSSQLRSGEKIADCARWLDTFTQVAAIGVNCTEPQYVAALINEIRRATIKPIIVYPNSGEHFDIGSRCWSGKESLPSYASLAREWFQAGARIIGGCCRTSPEDIRGISDWARPPSPSC